MKDTHLYQAILGLNSPWEVQGVEMNTKQEAIYIDVACLNKDWGCPKCKKRCYLHAYEERQWRHLDSCQFKTILRAKVPRVKCPDHGTQTVCVPWSHPGSRFTLLFERFAIDVLLSTSIKQAAELLRISWDQADGIKQRAVKRGQERSKTESKEHEHLCIDEKSYGHGHKYFTIVASINKAMAAKIIFIGDDRKESTLDMFWQSLSSSNLEAVKSISMDMWKPFMNSTIKYVPEGSSKIVYDRFHVVKHLNDAVNSVRKQEHARLLKEGDTRLKGTKYHWLYAKENRPDRIKKEWDDLKMEAMQTGRAWALKEQMRHFWDLCTPEEGRVFLGKWLNWAFRSHLDPMNRVAKMLKSRLNQLLNYFKTRVSNGPIEGLNGKIRAIVKKAYGHRNIERLKTDIFFHLGRLDLYPNTR